MSHGCRSCYAETLVTGRMGRPGTWGPGGTRERTSAALWRKPLRWNTLALEGKLPDGSANLDVHRPRVFCASLADVFEPRPEVQPWRFDLFSLIAATPNLDWLVLTKRPDYAAGWLRGYYDRCSPEHRDDPTWWAQRGEDWNVFRNLWIGTSIESTAYTWRADWLRLIPASVRFISAEPLLGSLFATPHAGGAATPGSSVTSVGSPDGASVAGSIPAGATGGSSPGEVTGENRTRPDAAGGTGDVQSAGASGPGSIPGLSTPQESRPLDRSVPAGLPAADDVAERSTDTRGRAPLDLTGISWLIVGGESGGRNARPMHPDWAREIRDAVLSLGEQPPDQHAAGRILSASAVDVSLALGRPALHFKQHGSYRPALPGERVDFTFPDGQRMHYAGPGPKAGGKLLDGVAWCEFPVSPVAVLA